jgi:Cu/Ag efflux pump CusA
MAIPGVANVAIWGQRDRQIQVLINPNHLQNHGVSTSEVVMAVKKAAEIVEGSPPAIGNAIVNDQPGLLLIVEKQPWGNTLEVTHQIEEILEALKPGLKDIEIDSTIFRPATFIEMSLRNLNRRLLIGCILVITVLAFALNDWRTALISVLAIMSSLMVALILTPALSLILLPRASEKKETTVMIRLKSWYEKLLSRIVRYPKRLFIIISVVLLATLVSLPFLGEDFLPDFKEYDFLMHWVEKPGTSIEAMDRITIRASKELRSIPGVRNFDPISMPFKHLCWIFPQEDLSR